MSHPPKPRKSKVVLVEDHPMFRERLAQVIDKDLEMQVAGEAGDVAGAITIIEATRPDVIIADITLKDSSGIELIKMLGARGIHTPVLVLSMHSEALYADRALRAGARGYITKDEDSSKVIEAIQLVLAGGIYLSEHMTGRAVQSFAEGSAGAGSSPIDSLTDRELEVFRLFGQGSTTKEVAAALNLSDNTICTYRQRLKEKLDVRNFTELYSRAARWVREQEA